MLEGHHCLFPRQLPSSYEQDCDWARPLENGEDEQDSGGCPGGKKEYSPSRNRRKSRKHYDPDADDEMEAVLPSDDTDRDGGNGYGSNYDTKSLIQSLGRDISINCLMRCSRSGYGLVASLNKEFRYLVRSGELYTLRRKAGIAEHWIYVCCNMHDWVAFDPHSRRWMQLPRMHSNECFRCSDKESLAVGTELLVFGKEFTSHVVLRYSILMNSWSHGVEMNSPRCLFGSASLGERAIVAGGCNAQGTIYSSAELYNSETQTWETLPSMNVERKMCSSVFMDGKFYVLGGVSNNGQLTCGEEFDLERRTWRIIDNMFPTLNEAAGAPPLVAVANNELYSADYAEKKLRKYDKKNNSWNILGGLPESSVSMNGWGLAFRACGECLTVIGGQRAQAGGILEVNSWIPGDDPPEWTLIGRKPRGSFVFNCAVMGC